MGQIEGVRNIKMGPIETYWDNFVNSRAAKWIGLGMGVGTVVSLASCEAEKATSPLVTEMAPLPGDIQLCGNGDPPCPSDQVCFITEKKANIGGTGIPVKSGVCRDSDFTPEPTMPVGTPSGVATEPDPDGLGGFTYSEIRFDPQQPCGQEGMPDCRNMMDEPGWVKNWFPDNEWPAGIIPEVIGYTYNPDDGLYYLDQKYEDCPCPSPVDQVCAFDISIRSDGRGYCQQRSALPTPAETVSSFACGGFSELEVTEKPYDNTVGGLVGIASDCNAMGQSSGTVKIFSFGPDTMLPANIDISQVQKVGLSLTAYGLDFQAFPIEVIWVDRLGQQYPNGLTIGVPDGFGIASGFDVTVPPGGYILVTIDEATGYLKRYQLFQIIP